MIPTGTSFLAHAPAACQRILAVQPAGPGSPQALIDDRGAAAALTIAQAEAALCRVPWHDEDAVAAWLLGEPQHAITALATLCDRPRSLVGERLAVLFPELAGLAVPRRGSSYEHSASPQQGPAPTPLADHVLRALGHALGDPAIADPAWRAVLTTVLLFADVAKGGDAALRAGWLARLCVDGAVHNEDSAVILRDVLDRGLRRAPPYSDPVHGPRWQRTAVTLVGLTGYLGMRLRGEVERDALLPLFALTREQPDEASRAALHRVFALINRCDTAAVRAGLWTPALAAAFAAEEAEVAAVCLGDAATDAPLRDALTPLAERVARLRHGALLDLPGDPRVQQVEQALAELAADAQADAETPVQIAQMGRKATPSPLSQMDRKATPSPLSLLGGRLARCNLWYAEAALGCLSLPAALRLLLLLTGIAARAGIDLSRRWHLDLLAVVPQLRDESGGGRPYPLRLLSALLAQAPLARLADGELAQDGAQALLTFPAQKGRDAALLVQLDAGEEARALLTLLPLYERKEAAAFHATLKALCDLYGLRKDDFDRVANEESYLATMNAARSDKARMLDFAAPGLICEVGPGGGVVLDLCAQQLPGSRVLGLDASAAAVEALHRRKQAEGRAWDVVHGDAFQLPEILRARGLYPADTVIFCSVLHEIFSYVPWPGEPGPDGSPAAPARFRLGSVLALVQAAYRALRPGGRVLIRDGLMPADEPRVLEFSGQDGAAWREGFLLFCKSYEARPIPYEELPEGRVRLSQRDLYEFLTTFTWGPAAFPYEIREQRAVLPRDEYLRRLLQACSAVDAQDQSGCRAQEIPVPADLASYLQPDYPLHILPHVRVLDQGGAAPVPLPDITGVLVIARQPQHR